MAIISDNDDINLARPWAATKRCLCDLRPSKTSTLRSRRCSVRSGLRVWSPQSTRSHCLEMTSCSLLKGKESTLRRNFAFGRAGRCPTLGAFLRIIESSNAFDPLR